MLLVAGHVYLGVRISVFDHISATLQFQVLMSMQTDAYLKKRQIGTLLFGWGHWMGVFGGGALRGVHPKKYTCLPKKASWVYYDLGEVGTHLIKSAVLSCR